MKIVATIEARMSSHRLPGKVLMPVCGKPLLHHMVERLTSVSLIDEVVLATTTNEADDVLSKFAKSHNLACYRGEENDVLARVIGAAEYAGGSIIAETTGDCPIIDPKIVEQTIRMYLNHDVDYVSNCDVRSYPDGMDVQVFSLEALRKSSSLTNVPLDREHVSLHMRRNPEIFSKVHLIAPPDLFWPDLGLTVDEIEDFRLIQIIIEALYKKNHLFDCREIIEFIKANPNYLEINQHISRKGDT